MMRLRERQGADPLALAAARGAEDRSLDRAGHEPNEISIGQPTNSRRGTAVRRCSGGRGCCSLLRIRM